MAKKKKEETNPSQKKDEKLSWFFWLGLILVAPYMVVTVTIVVAVSAKNLKVGYLLGELLFFAAYTVGIILIYKALRGGKDGEKEIKKE